MSHKTLTPSQLKRIDRLITALESLSKQLFQEGDPLDREIYGLLFKLQSLRGNGSYQPKVELSALLPVQ